jgi:metal-responsive CopG/Arc/MetJ family transcriptional regulator
MRFLVDVPDDELQLLNSVVKKLEISRAEFIRQAVASALAPHRKTMNHSAFGAWAGFREDGLNYQQRRREEW